MLRICVFAGSNDGDRDSYLISAHELGAEIARRGHGLVYGGASCGLMGACADAALAGGAGGGGGPPRAPTPPGDGPNRVDPPRLARGVAEGQGGGALLPAPGGR